MAHAITSCAGWPTEHPDLVEAYERLYTGKYPPKGYTNEVQSVIGMLKKKYGVAGER